MLNIIRKMKNFLGEGKGWGKCYHCGDLWSWKKWKDIPYAPDSAMFPICKECYDILPVEKIVRYCQQLIDKWKGDLINLGRIGSYEKLVVEAVDILENCEKFIRADKSIKVDLSMWKKFPMYAG